jgi:hypothetical protein
MKKFSMGMMLSSLLLIPVGCGEEAPPAPATPDPAAMMGHAVEGDADKAGEVDADKTGEVIESDADKAGEVVEGAVEEVKDAAP